MKILKDHTGVLYVDAMMNTWAQSRGGDDIESLDFLWDIICTLCEYAKQGIKSVHLSKALLAGISQQMDEFNRYFEFIGLECAQVPSSEGSYLALLHPYFVIVKEFLANVTTQARENNRLTEEQVIAWATNAVAELQRISDIIHEKLTLATREYPEINYNHSPIKWFILDNKSPHVLALVTELEALVDS